MPPPFGALVKATVSVFADQGLSLSNSACCELRIESDDPDNREVTIFVTGHLRRRLSSALKCSAGQELQEMLKAGKSC